MMSIIYMYKQDLLTLDQLHESLSQYEIRLRRRIVPRKSYSVQIDLFEEEEEEQDKEEGIHTQ